MYDWFFVISEQQVRFFKNLLLYIYRKIDDVSCIIVIKEQGAKGTL